MTSENQSENPFIAKIEAKKKEVREQIAAEKKARETSTETIPVQQISEQETDRLKLFAMEGRSEQEIRIISSFVIIPDNQLANAENNEINIGVFKKRYF